MNLVRPEIFPEEYGRGFKGRLMQRNGVTDEETFNQMLLQWAGRPGSSLQEVPMVDLLAAAAGMEPSAFVQQHSLLPLRRATVNSGWEQPHGSHERAGLLWTSTFRMCRPEAFFCEECVAEDIDFHGTPYWRREHQLPGQFWCVKHRRLLRFIRGESAFLLSPSYCVERASHVDVAWAESLQRCAAIERFIAIASDLLHRQFPLSGVVVSRRLREIASQRGFHYGQGEIRGELLSDFLLEVFDRRWLSNVIRNIEGKVFKEYFPTIDLATTGNCVGTSSNVYIAAFAALFDDVEEAIAALVSGEIGPHETPSEPPSALIDADAARRMYVEFRGSYQGIAKALDVDRRVVARHLKQYGLPSLGKRSIERLHDLMLRFTRDGLSVDWACDGDRASQQFLELYLRSSSEHLMQALEAMQRDPEPQRRRQPNAKAEDPATRNRADRRGGDDTAALGHAGRRTSASKRERATEDAGT